jgi:ubiquinone/menaquinone biosynthesis C-methylase UbiE
MDNNRYQQALEDSAKTERHRRPPYQEYDDFILSMLKGRCLEIGCGDGIGTRTFYPKCRSLVSLDLAPERIQRAKDNTKGLDVEFRNADARQLPFADESFDTVLAFEIYEHFPGHRDQEKFLSEAARVLKKDGVFLVSTPNRPLFRLYCRLTKEKHSTHFTEVNYFQFQTALKKVFFRVAVHGKFGWLSPWYRFKLVRSAHNFLSRFPLICKGMLAVCRK